MKLAFNGTAQPGGVTVYDTSKKGICKTINVPVNISVEDAPLKLEADKKIIVSDAQGLNLVFVDASDVVSITQFDATELAGGTAATATVEFAEVGDDGDTVLFKAIDVKGTLSLGTYTKGPGETTLTQQVVTAKNVINGGTATHGYIATNSIDVLTITAPKRNGDSINGGSNLIVTASGAIADLAVTQFAGGISNSFTSAVDLVIALNKVLSRTVLAS